MFGTILIGVIILLVTLQLSFILGKLLGLKTKWSLIFIPTYANLIAILHYIVYIFLVLQD